MGVLEHLASVVAGYGILLFVLVRFLLIWYSVHALTLRRHLVGWHSKLIVALALRPWAALLPAALRGGADERAPTVGQL